MSAAHTPGPWRWEISMKSKRLHLVGGRKKYDLTIIDFERWGMNQATIRLRDTAHDGMNLMYKLHERPDWIEPFPGREHHKEWCSNVIHPDARRIVACVNRLEPFTTEQIEDDGFDLFHETRPRLEDAIFKAKLAEARAAALFEFIENVCVNSYDTRVATIARKLKQANDTIKAEGGAT